jgi:non-ribosomal peptide synthetase component E (peptide arylation enzyme)
MRANADTNMAVHRIIEANAAQHGDVPAITGAGITLSYRELNQRANAMARHLLAQGFRRGGVATVCLRYNAETAVVLLGILKAGGSYVMMNPTTAPAEWPRGVSFAGKVIGDEISFQMVDIAPALERASQSCANLPIVVRGTDLACVIADTNGEPRLLVPHATIMSLKNGAAPRFAEWFREAGALDLWAALMSGASVTLTDAAFRSAA